MFIHLNSYIPVFVKEYLESVDSTSTLAKGFLAVPLIHNLFFAVKIEQRKRMNSADLAANRQWEQFRISAIGLKRLTYITAYAIATLAYLTLPATMAFPITFTVVILGAVLFVDQLYLERRAASIPRPPPPPRLPKPVPAAPVAVPVAVPVPSSTPLSDDPLMAFENQFWEQFMSNSGKCSPPPCGAR